MSRVLLIEDHERFAALIRQALSPHGIAVDEAGSIEAAWAALSLNPYDALVLDRGLPDGDGLKLLQRARRQGLGVPCLVLTARDALHDRIEGLDAGADDYLPKPFAMDEMIARVKALLRRPAVQRTLAPEVGDLRLLADEGLICCKDERITLAPAEMQIMLALMHRPGEIVRRSAIEAAGWGLSEAVTPNALDVALYRLRRKLLAIGSTHRIFNVRGLGFSLREHDAAD